MRLEVIDIKLWNTCQMSFTLRFFSFPSPILSKDRQCLSLLCIHTFCSVASPLLSFNSRFNLLSDHRLPLSPPSRLIVLIMTLLWFGFDVPKKLITHQTCIFLIGCLEQVAFSFTS